MSDRSAISWCDATWNPVRGCTKVSAGCKNCYAERFSERFRGVKGHPFEQGFDVRLVPKAIDLPLRWRKPRRIFVNSMSDLFHPDVPFEFIAAVFGVTATCPQHTFLILTKRPGTMREWCAWLEERAEQCRSVFPDDPYGWRRAHCLSAAALRAGVSDRDSAGQIEALGWPLPNVWLGVSVENQETADERIPILLDTPAAHRFVSCEPLLDGLDLELERYLLSCKDCGNSGSGAYDGTPGRTPCLCSDACIKRGEGPSLDWVIVGGESGPGARPCDIAWIRSIVRQCESANVPCYVKQFGSHAIVDYYDRDFRYLYEVKGWEWPDAEDWDERDGQPRPGSRSRLSFSDRSGRDPSEWPEDVRVQQFPEGLCQK